MENAIYKANGQEVRLSENGTFTASLSGGINKSGTYTTSEIDDITVEIVFEVDDEEFYGDIINNALSLPEAWDNGSGDKLMKQ